jgi:hypothetical protein
MIPAILGDHEGASGFAVLDGDNPRPYARKRNKETNRKAPTLFSNLQLVRTLPSIPLLSFPLLSLRLLSHLAVRVHSQIIQEYINDMLGGTPCSTRIGPSPIRSSVLILRIGLQKQIGKPHWQGIRSHALTISRIPFPPPPPPRPICLPLT